MQVPGIKTSPLRRSYDVVIIGGAIMGSSTAWFLTDNKQFKGSILVVEKDPTYEKAATTLTNSCIRQQFSTALNVKVSQFGAEFFQNLRTYMGGDERVPEMKIRNFGLTIKACSSLIVSRNLPTKFGKSVWSPASSL